MTQLPEDNANDVGLPVLEPEGSRWGKANHILGGFAAAAAAVWLLSGFYKVNTDEVAIVERLGQFVASAPGGPAVQIGQGLHYRIPWPIDRVFKIPIQQTRILTVDTFYKPADAYADFKRELMRTSPEYTPEVLAALFDPYLITADKNVIHVSISVNYRIDDPEAWLQTVSHESGETSVNPNMTQDMREQLFQEVVQHVLVEEVAKLPVEKMLFVGQEQLPPLFQNAIQEALKIPDPTDPTGKKRIPLGVDVLAVTGVTTHWPAYDTVDKAFQSVLSARSDAGTALARAQSDRQSAINQAQSEKQTLVRQAEAYKKQSMDNAQGEATRFSLVMEQYKSAPDVTRWNVFAETVSAVSGAAKRIMFVQPGQRTVLTIDPPQFDANQVQPQGGPGQGPPPGR